MSGKYEFSEVEPEILEFWQKNKTYKKAKEQNKGKKQFYFLDGPPYTSGRVHIGTAWNKSLKDLALRYRRMAGYDTWDRAGYDMHGMPTEQATMKELKICKKEDILRMSVEKFVNACKELSIRNMNYMNEDFKRLGVWMDFENPYMPITREYIEGEWWLIKKAHERKRLYEGEKTMTWCSACGTALAKHELEYKNVRDKSIFLKFALADKKDEYLIIWTTTPWTIPFNLGVMVNPDLEYVKAKVGKEKWIVAKGLAGGVISFVANEKFEVIEEFTGDKLKGLRYIHPLEEELKNNYDKIRKKSKKVHTIALSSEYVNLSAGTGLVHMAPGCGPEDYEVGHREGIPPFNTLSESGIFPKEMGPFAEWTAKTDDKKFIEYFEKKGALVAATDVEHDYAHCWRCKKPVIYRTTSQWFFKVEDLKDEMRKLNSKIKWVPEYAGSRNFDSWLENLRDNGITRQRFWGTPLPVWKCNKCSRYDVIGSIKELEELAGKLPKDLHKPWIDDIKYICTDCGGIKKRVPDILDVWIDAGSASWNCLNFPQKKELFNKLFPADFILEGIDQIRGWFNLLFVASMVSMNKPSFKSVFMHGFVQDSQGRKMSKSLGNYILPSEVIEKYGADTLRYYMIGGTNAGEDINYNFEDMKIKHKNLGILWNLANYAVDLADSTKSLPKKPDANEFMEEEKYIISKMNSIIKKQTEYMENYNLNEAPGAAEELFLELSRTYIQLIREKSAVGSKKEKQMVLDVIYDVLNNNLKIFAPVCPMICEKLYLKLKEKFNTKEESIHLCSWPEYDESMIDEELEKNFDITKEIIQALLFGREKIQMGQRWPLKEAIICTDNKKTQEAIKALRSIITKQTNIKNIKTAKEAPLGKKNYFELEFKSGKIIIDTEITPELEEEGYAREIMRRVQNMRKKAGLKKDDRINLCITAKKEITAGLGRWKKEISEKVGAKEIHISEKGCKEYKTSLEQKIKGNIIKICFEQS